MNRLWHLRALVGVLLVSLVGIGCSKYVRVESTLTSMIRESEPEITSTARYREVLGKVTKVAIRAPDSCANETAATTTGEAQAKGTVVKTSCGVEMAEIERQLAQRGYKVFSWKNINNMVQSGGMTVIDAARHLGAEVLFQVNSLERIQANSGQDAVWKRSFQKSNAYADNLGSVDDTSANMQRLWKAMSARNEEQLLDRKRLGAMLDVNAVMVDSGETIWFYRSQLLSSEDASQTMVSLLFGKGNRWTRVYPRHRRAGGSDDVEMRGGTEIEAVSTAADPASRTDAKYHELLRQAVIDFVQRFSEGK